VPDGDWVSTEEVAYIMSQAMGRDIDKETLQRWIRRSDHRIASFRIWKPARDYLWERGSILRAFDEQRQRIDAMLAEQRRMGHTW
jgi:hypothetical protein